MTPPIIRAVVFDFDGVIIESVDVKTAAFAKLFEHEGSEVVAAVVQYHLANGGISRFEKFRHYYNNILRRTLSVEEEKDLGQRFSNLVMDGVLKAPYVKGAVEVLEHYYRHTPLYVASGTPHDELMDIVVKRKLGKYFKGVYGSPQQKAAILGNVVRSLNVSPERVVMIGDAMSDYNAAITAGTCFVGREKPGEEGLFRGKGVEIISDLCGLSQVLQKISGKQVFNG